MSRFSPLLSVAVTGAVLLSTPPVNAAEVPANSKVLLDMAPGVEQKVKPSSEQVSAKLSTDAAAPGLIMTVKPGNDGYPGIAVVPSGGTLDLSSYGHVEARVTNMGPKAASFNLRIDDNGDWKSNPWNAESVWMNPNEAKVVKTIFGHSYGFKPAHPLKSNAVSQLLMFTGKVSAEQAFRIEYLVAAGPAGEKPPVDPKSIRIKPQDGFLFGGGVALDAAKQVTGNKGATAALNGEGSLQVKLPTSKESNSVTIKPAEGRWDLRDYLQVEVQLRNPGQTPVTPRLRLDSNGGQSDSIVGPVLEPGKTANYTVPFAAAAPANLADKNSGSKLTNDSVSGLVVSASDANTDRILEVKSIRASMPKLVLADWLGKRPPVEGEWFQTLNENFDKPTLDPTLWSVYGANYWDKKSHWSKDNVLLDKGTVKLRYEKKTGFNNDDPKEKSSDYQSGYLHTYDRWAQRYGYFEARTKLPKAPGLWPAFWMMPDRGRDKGPEQWRRQDTKFGGMEFDIMEHLTRWGPNRYNIAMHYDGYDKEHKSIGTSVVYAQPDKDGYITTGLLWTPGSAIYYCNGQEVLRWENPRISEHPAMLMFTLPMGGWDNSPLEDAKLPDDFVVDYVRVWQRKDLVNPGDGVKPVLPPIAPAN